MVKDARGKVKVDEAWVSIDAGQIINADRVRAQMEGAVIFGASLVGVAEDYGIHWFASRQGVAAARRWSLLRQLLPGLWLALLTSALAYLALGLAPFPSETSF